MTNGIFLRTGDAVTHFSILHIPLSLILFSSIQTTPRLLLVLEALEPTSTFHTTMAFDNRPGSASKPPSKVRWGELEEDDGEDFDFLLPPRQVIGPDENGIKKVIEYKFNDDGNKVKITTTTRVRKLAKARLSKRAVERRSWPKFGDAVHEDVGARLTMVSTEEILLERPRAPGSSFLFLCPYVCLNCFSVLVTKDVIFTFSS